MVKDMTKNFRKLDKFEGHDFRRWHKKMHFLLTTLKVVYVLTTPMPELMEDATVEAKRIRAKWENDDYICQWHILNGMSDCLFDVYTNVESAKELWDSLESKSVAKLATLRGIAVVETRRITQGLVVWEKGLRTNPKTKVDAIAWWIDSGATTHVCKDRCWFKTYEPVKDGSVLYMGDDHFALVHGKGIVVLEFSYGKSITLFNVLYVPKLHKNLISGPVLNKCGYKQVYESDKYIIPTGRVVVATGRYIVPTGRVVVPTGRYVVPTGRVVVATGRYIVPTGRVVVPTGRYVVPAGSDNESDDASVHNEAPNTQQQPNIQPQIITTVSKNNAKFPYLKKDEYERESKARTTLLQSIPDDHVADFHYMDDARDIWNAIKARFGRNAESKKIRKSMLSKAEGLHKGYDRMQKILSQLVILKSLPCRIPNTNYQ
nr:zinc finger, CCHC-type [Tanacetum cinerariifolium]